MTLHTELFQAQKRDQQYIYAYDKYKRKRILKNLFIQLNGSFQEAEYIMLFDYLSSQEKAVNRMILFIELVHYFITNCTMRSAIWYFAEGELGLDYFMKAHLNREQKPTNTNRIRPQLLGRRHPFLLFVKDNRVQLGDIPIVDIDRLSGEVMRTKNIKKYEEIFCTKGLSRPKE